MSQQIVITRGDTYNFNLSIIDETSSAGIYFLQDDDVLYFRIMRPNQPFEEAIIEKKYTVEDMDAEGIISLCISSEDTINLEPGRYYYSVKLSINNSTAKKEVTIIDKSKFIICD